MPKWSNYREATPARGPIPQADRKAGGRLLDLDRIAYQPRLRKYRGTSKSYRAHRLAYKFWVGPIPPGHWVLRRCNNPLCCNPEHLYTSAGRANLEERLLDKIIKHENGCWIWQGHIENGYGRIVLAGHRFVVHRAAYELWVEPIPDGLQVQHLCNNRHCCNPAHLVAGTAQENAALRAQYREGGLSTGDDHLSVSH